MLLKIKKSTEFILERLSSGFSANTAIVLGTGLNNFIKETEILETLSFAEIPFFSETTIEGHQGKLIYSRYKSKYILILQGRVHFYEGHTMSAVTYPVRVLKMLGIKNLILTNAAGGMNPEFSIGDLMIITDHINLMPNPLKGKHFSEFGERFPDMSQVYDSQLISLAEEIARGKDIDINKGIYVGVTGPTYETPAEYRYFRIIGGDAVGMSTVPEAIVAHQMGIKCFAISIITDFGVPGSIEYLSHEMVQKAASDAEPKLAGIILELINRL